jgi:hypothetical protein
MVVQGLGSSCHWHVLGPDPWGTAKHALGPSGSAGGRVPQGSGLVAVLPHEVVPWWVIMLLYPQPGGLPHVPPALHSGCHQV